MPGTKLTFEQKRVALCYCCGGWQNASKSDIETRWSQLPEKRAASFLHRVDKLRNGTDDQKKQYQAFVSSLPDLQEEKPEAIAKDVKAPQAPGKPEPTKSDDKPDKKSSSKT